MLNDKWFILLLFIGLVFRVAVIDVFAQSEGHNHKKPQTVAQNEQGPIDKRSNPILLSVRAGSYVSADLIGPDPRDTDAVIVEVKGGRRSFKLDEVRILPQARKFDEYGNVASNDEKARLDGYAAEIHNTPGVSANVIVYGTCIGQGRARAKRIRDYLVNQRGLDGGRVVTLDSTCRTDFKVELWIVPSGADPPRNTDDILKRCPSCPKPKPTRKSRKRK